MGGKSISLTVERDDFAIIFSSTSFLQFVENLQLSLVPRPLHSFCRLQYKKRGEPGNEAICS